MRIGEECDPQMNADEKERLWRVRSVNNRRGEACLARLF